MRRVSFRAMGTDIILVGDRESGLDDAAAWFASVEQVCSRFRVDSELSQLNGSSAELTAVSPLLASALRAARRVYHLTDGLVDAGMGGIVETWGYDRTFREVRDLAAAPATLAEPRWGIAGNVVRTSVGTSLDLGGIAKGWTCDVAVEQGMVSIASAGGDMRSRSAEATAVVADPWGEPVAEVRVGCGALATSSVTRRRWKVGETDAHHLIDPRTGAPTDSPVLSATVVADSAVEAEAGAKAVLLRGAEGLAWADAVPWIRSALVVWRDGSVYATSAVEVAA